MAFCFSSFLISAIALPGIYDGKVPWLFSSGSQLLLITQYKAHSWNRGGCLPFPSGAALATTPFPAADIFCIFSFPRDSGSLLKSWGLEFPASSTAAQAFASYERKVRGRFRISFLCALPPVLVVGPRKNTPLVSGVPSDYELSCWPIHDL